MQTSGLAWKIVAIAVIAACASDVSAFSIKDVREILEKTEEYEVYSLDPNEGLKDPKGFHDWKVLGKTSVKDADVRKALTAAYFKGISDSDGTAAKCFIPRHGIRAKLKDKTVDVLICFECLRVQIFLDGKVMSETTTRSPQKLFDEVLTKAGVPLAKKAVEK